MHHHVAGHVSCVFECQLIYYVELDRPPAAGSTHLDPLSAPLFFGVEKKIFFIYATFCLEKRLASAAMNVV